MHAKLISWIIFGTCNEQLLNTRGNTNVKCIKFYNCQFYSLFACWNQLGVVNVDCYFQFENNKKLILSSSVCSTVAWFIWFEKKQKGSSLDCLMDGLPNVLWLSTKLKYFMRVLFELCAPSFIHRTIRYLICFLKSLMFKFVDLEIW